MGLLKMHLGRAGTVGLLNSECGIISESSSSSAPNSSQVETASSSENISRLDKWRSRVSAQPPPPSLRPPTSLTTAVAAIHLELGAGGRWIESRSWVSGLHAPSVSFICSSGSLKGEPADAAAAAAGAEWSSCPEPPGIGLSLGTAVQQPVPASKGTLG